MDDEIKERLCWDYDSTGKYHSERFRTFTIDALELYEPPFNAEIDYIIGGWMNLKNEYEAQQTPAGQKRLEMQEKDDSGIKQARNSVQPEKRKAYTANWIAERAKQPDISKTKPKGDKINGKVAVH